MELFFLFLLIAIMAGALASGYPVAFALPGSAILTVLLAAGAGYLFAGDMDAYFAQGGPNDWLASGVTNFRGIYWEVERDTLIAIPLFIFMGIMLQRSKIAEDLLVTMAQLFGPVPGGLGISVIFVGALLAATTGILGATVVAMGLISLPAMLRNNYSPSLATGAIAASGTLGQIIPPSIVLIILADQLASAVDQAGTARQSLYKAATGNFSMPSEFAVVSTSAGDMFLGAMIPGLILVALYMLYVLAVGIIRPAMAPSVRTKGRMDGRFFVGVAFTLIPPLALIFVVLGSIITGVATVNQAGAIGAAGALIMAGYRLRPELRLALLPAFLAIVSVVGILILTHTFQLNVKNIKTSEDRLGIALGVLAVVTLLISVFWSAWRAYQFDKTLHGVMRETAKTTSLVFIILLGAAMLTAAFRAFGGEDLVREFLTSLPGGFWTQFIIVMAVIFFLGFFLDFIEIAVVVVPIVAPILLMDPEANVTAVWLGVMIGLNIQTSFLTPPFGFALFYLRGVAPAVVRTIDMYKGVVPFIALQLFALVIVGSYPALVNYLPSRMSLLSETAPPPRNPRLQHCIEQHVFDVYDRRGDEIRRAIQSVRALDTSYLPDSMKRDLDRALTDAEKTFEHVAAIRKTDKVVAEKTPAYEPLHRKVRDLQERSRRIAEDIKRHDVRISRLRSDDEQAAKRKLEVEREALKTEQDSLRDQIPEDWEARHKAFAALQNAERRARLLYRRTADSAYRPVRKTLDALQDTTAFKALGDRLRALGPEIDNTNAKAAAGKFEAVMKAVGDVEGARAVRSALVKARRALRRGTPDRTAAREAYQQAVSAYEAQLAWRARAVATLQPELENYEAIIRNTLGLRQQARLPRGEALSVAACSAHHRDISLSF